MNAILEAMVGIALFVIITAFVTSHVQDIFLANAQEAFYESLKQRGYVIASLIKLWLETQQNSIEEIKGMNDDDFQKIFIDSSIKNIMDSSIKKIVVYVKISSIVEISGFFRHFNIDNKEILLKEWGNKEISSRAIRVVDIAKAQNTLCLIEVYLWIGGEVQVLKQG